MGLITEGDRYAILTDIQGLEDALGDMDFKVAGTDKGINALQMDIKTRGLSYEIMEKALSSVRSIEITHAVRSTKVNGLKIKRKQPIGLLDGDLVAVGNSELDVINKVLGELDMDKAEVVTIYYGAEAESAEAEQEGTSVGEQYPQLQIEVIRGGQPHYSYILSVE